MRLVNMDVDRIGTRERCQLGQFSPHLNAILGSKGSGKSTLLGWLRTIAEENLGRTYSHPDPAWQSQLPMLAGAAEIYNRELQYRVTTDRNGRVRFDEVNGYGVPSVLDSVRREWDGKVERSVSSTNLSPIQKEAFAGLAAANGRYDTEAALEQLAQRLGIEGTQVRTNDPRAALEAREREISASLDRIRELHVSRDVLVTRQQHLETELASAQRNGQTLRYEGKNVEHLRLFERSTALEADLQDCLQQVANLDREIDAKQSELKMLEIDPTVAQVDESFRVQLQKLDDRLNRWRQTLRDLKSHRETIEHNATEARLDKQIGDQFSATKEADPRAAMRSLEAQILHTRQQLDVLVERYTTIPGYDYRSASAAVAGTGFRPNEVPHSHGVYRDATGHTYVGHPTYLPESTALPETLRSMQKDLHEVCQQLARHEAQTAMQTLRDQSAQLKRCEQELLESVEKLIDERASLLRTIANDHHISVEQLTLAFGKWCQCHDHPHLHDWLLSEESNCPTRSADANPLVRQQLLDELHALQDSRKAVAVRADELRRQMKDADVHRRGVVTKTVQAAERPLAEIQSDLHQVSTDLAAIADRDRWIAELNEIRAQLADTPKHSMTENWFRQLTDRHVVGLMGPNTASQDYDTAATNGHTKHYDLVDGVNGKHYARPQSRRSVPSEIVRIAMRLAIAESLASRGETISLVIDDALEGLPVEIQTSAVAYLARVSIYGSDAVQSGDRGPIRSAQQIILLTADGRVAELVRQQNGWVGSMQHATYYPQETHSESPDINQHLSALANDHEADKWYHPVITTKPDYRGVRNAYYLTENSLVEDLPAIDPDLAARCRTCGVDRIGDLLDVDPEWLADNLNVRGISVGTVEIWQAVAELLCSVPNLRPFDARVIVGAGIRAPGELASVHPSQLLDRVERFLTTDRGRRILSSGSSYELSRITAWIAAAKGGADHHWNQDARSNGYRVSRQGYRSRSSRSSRSGSRTSRDGRNYSVISRNGTRSSRRTREDRDYSPREYERRERTNKSREYERSREDRRQHLEAQRSTSDRTKEENRLKFYLELASPIVDAPSIGPRMATKLEEHGITTVEELLTADAEWLAEQLDHRRVDAGTIVAWQDQARLVCRIPNLRGHDAQLLVACSLTSPEEIATLNAATVLEQVSEIAHSKEGQRILRGSKEPDLEEVSNWIAWAGQCRRLAA